MATGKRYYWIKLSKDFLNSEVVDFLLSQKNGAEYVVLYLKLCMMCINTQGRLEQKIGEVIVPFDAEKIQRDCKYFSKDTVIVATQLYKKLGLIYEDQEGALVISNFDGMVGSATDYALQKRNQRANSKLQIEGSVDNVHSNVQDNVLENVHTEYRDKSIEIRDKSIEIEKDKTTTTSGVAKKAKPQKHKHGEFAHVLLTDTELSQLIEKYGQAETDEAIKYLDEYMEMKGKKYKSCYLALIKWVFDAVKEKRQKKSTVTKQQNLSPEEETAAWLKKWEEI